MGSLTISLDFELGWGAIESRLWKSREKRGVYRDLRNVLPRFVARLDALEIPLTWATVGAMVSRPTVADFDHLPATTKGDTLAFLRDADEATRDARDLLDTILGARTTQDIGSHTFSHTRWSLDDYGRTAKTDEMTKAKRALANYDVRPASFVYPLNHFRDLDVIAESGFSIARTAPRRPTTRPGKFLEMLKGYSPSSRIELQPNGLMTETGSLFYAWGTRRDWPLRRQAIIRQVHRGLKLATQSDHALHLWLHPFNLVETRNLYDDSIALLNKAAHLRDRGQIQIQTMRDKQASSPRK